MPFPSLISSAPFTFGGLSLRELDGLGDSDPSFDFLRDEKEADFFRNDMAGDAERVLRVKPSNKTTMHARTCDPKSTTGAPVSFPR